VKLPVSAMATRLLILSGSSMSQSMRDSDTSD
jgi:hypothetical protein